MIIRWGIMILTPLFCGHWVKGRFLEEGFKRFFNGPVLLWGCALTEHGHAIGEGEKGAKLLNLKKPNGEENGQKTGLTPQTKFVPRK